MVEVDGKSLDLGLSGEATAASAFPMVRDEILRSGRIVTSVKVGSREVTWNDGSPIWGQRLSPENRLAVTADYPIRVTSPVLARVIESLPRVAEEHRKTADTMRGHGPKGANGAANLLGIWTDLQQAIEQVCTLHSMDLDAADWKPNAERFRDLFGKLNGALKELKESLELGDMVLAADILEFELASLAEEWVEPVRKFQEELERRFPAEQNGSFANRRTPT